VRRSGRNLFYQNPQLFEDAGFESRDIMEYMKSIKFFTQKILKYYHQHGRHYLPWRKLQVTPYEIWVSEIMLQQTQVNRVIKYYEKFIKKFSTVFELADSDWETFLPYYSGMGYYQRGKNMLKTARIVVEKYQGVFPNNKTELMKLPGIGEYTAEAILTFAFQAKYLPKDTNVQKVFGRFLHGDKKFDLDMPTINTFLRGDRRKLTLGVMDFANDICLNQPRCHDCPIAVQCKYNETKGRLELGISNSNITQKTNFPSAQAQVYLWLHKNHQEYYSTSRLKFRIFILPMPYNTRTKIKEYFRTKYCLEIAVRPPYKKVFIKEKPTLFVNAQILLGKHTFYSHPRKAVVTTQNLIEGQIP